MNKCGQGEPKITKLVEVLKGHFERARAEGIQDSRVMVFTNLRDGVATIQDSLNELVESGISARCAAFLLRHSWFLLRHSPLLLKHSPCLLTFC